MEREPNDETRLRAEEPPFDPDREDFEHQHTFRHWMAVNEQSVRVFLLIAAYASFMLYLASLVLLGGPSLLTKIFSVVPVTSLVAAYILLRVSGPVDRDGRTIWQVYRSTGKERVEKRIAAALWLFIAIAVPLLLVWSRRHQP
jgi:glucan phosphoethanolaminetransferase (alkaline phosphatase superfamily)